MAFMVIKRLKTLNFVCKQTQERRANENILKNVYKYNNNVLK